MNTSSTEIVHRIMEIAVVLADRIVENYQQIREQHPDREFPGVFVDSLIDANDIQDQFAAWCRQRAAEMGNANNPQVICVSTPPSTGVSYDELKSNLKDVQTGIVMHDPLATQEASNAITLWRKLRAMMHYNAGNSKLGEAAREAVTLG